MPCAGVASCANPSLDSTVAGDHPRRPGGLLVFLAARRLMHWRHSGPKVYVTRTENIRYVSADQDAALRQRNPTYE